MTFPSLTHGELDQRDGTIAGVPAEIDNQRHDSHFHQARRHSFIVGFLKRALPLLALALVAGFAAMSLFNDRGTVNASIGSTEIKDGKLIMVEPRMKGFNSDNRPYDLDARQAVQDLNNPGIIDLEGIVAKLPTDGGGFVDITAKNGNYDSDQYLLKLEENIVLTRASGMKILLDSAEINLKNGRLVSDRPVKVTTATSDIRSDKVEVIDNGAVIIFEQRVRMNFQPATD